MQKLLKTLVVLLVAGIISWGLLWPGLIGQAAPNRLPSCGHSPISQSSDRYSGGADIAFSADNTAVVWSGERSPGIPSFRGTIQLAHSDVQTRTRTWYRLNPPVDADTGEDTGNQDPTLIFDPDDPATVHVAYKKGKGIYYQKCVLQEKSTARDCTPIDITYSDNDGQIIINHDNPQIAILNNQVVVVYQETDETDQFNIKRFLRYAYINKDTGTLTAKNKKLTNNLTTVKEENPAVIVANGKLHVAYVKNTGFGIGYLNMEQSDLAAGNKAEAETFAVAGMEAGFPAMGANDNYVAAVWRVKDAGGDYRLVYNVSDDNGADWLATNYIYLLNNSASSEGKVWNTDSGNSEFAGLRPDATVDEDDRLHVVWHAKDDGVSSNYQDILYARLNLDDNYPATPPNYSGMWIGNTYISGGLAQYTNVTNLYRADEFNRTGQNLRKVRPKIVFGLPGKRLQLVYMSETAAAGWDIYYNGWQLEYPPGTTFVDSDCDWIIDDDEQGTCPAAPDPDDCDGDGIPNHLDENSDNDVEDDFQEKYGDDPDGPYDPSSEGGIFAPIIVKN